MTSKLAIWILPLVAVTMVGCRKPDGTVLGKAPGGEPRTIVAVREGLTPSDVTVHGSIVEKCPTAGCWFYLTDGTGILKVDTKNAGYVVTDLALQTEVTVSGRLVQQGDETVLDSTGLRY